MHRAVRAPFLALSLTAVMAVGVQANAGGVAAVPLNNGQETTDAKYGGSGSCGDQRQRPAATSACRSSRRSVARDW